ncbi:MAG: DUF3597 domain-containing protein [Comamonadaceae bacterium]|nr:MAG: DUF3597 domain-containing protein [Comamonadaceae bacterium]
MGFFSKILSKLGMDAGAGKVEEMLNTPVPPKAPANPGTATAGAGPAATPAAGAAAPAGAAQAVDVTALLEQKAAANGQKLNWRTSIVDLLKLLDIDSSLQARKELATELGCPPDLMADSAKMNMWLHKAVMQKLAANGGKVPAELLD